MKKIILITILTFLISVLKVFTFEITYTYDAAGNRIARNYTTVVLKQADTSQVKSETGECLIKVFPNPVKELLNIEIYGLGKSNISKLQIYNIKGELLLSNDKLEAGMRIAFDKWASGIYFLHISIDDKISYYKIIKED